MDKKLQDHVWKHRLPKEFKEEVKDNYRKLMSALGYFQSKTSLNNEECNRCDLIREKIAIYNTLFGHHNLTSDAEGEEDEILTVSRKDMQFYYQYYKAKRESELSAEQKAYYKGRAKVLLDLFGSKCLPDEPGNFQATCPPDNVDTLKPNVDTSAEHFADVRKMMPSRLYIATQITASIYANCEAAKQFHSIEAIVRKALDIADTLMSEAEKGGEL